MRHVSAIFTTALVLISTSALAQPKPTQPQPELPQGVMPPAIVVDDPDLVPLPPAKRVVNSWDEISSFLRARSADLRIAIDEVARAEAQKREAYANILGSIVANGGYTHNLLTNTSSVSTQTGLGCMAGTPNCITTTVPAPDYANANIVAGIQVIAPRWWNAIHMGGVNIDVQQAALDDERRMLATNVANAALNVVTNERIAELNRVGLRQALELVELAKKKTSLGAGTGLDIIRAQQNAETARTTLVSGDETARQARESFGIAIGIAEDVGVAGDLSFDTITKQVLSQCKAAPSVEDRPDVIAARERVHYARLMVWDVDTQFIPVVSLQSTLSTTTLSYVSPQTQWNLQALITWNIWDGGLRYGQRRDNKLQVLEMEERLEAARRTAAIQVVQAQRGVQVAEQTRVVSLRSRDLAAEVDRLTRQGFMTGLYTSLDLVTSSTALRTADINLALAEFGLIKAKIVAVLTLATCTI